MDAAPTVEIDALTAAQVCARFAITKEARSLLRDGMGPGPYIEVLLANKQYIAGIDFLAHALPPREGVWWGCLCFQHACGEEMSALDRAAAKATVEWLLRPGDEARFAAKCQGEAAGPFSVVGSLAMAAYQAGPNLISPNGLPIPMPPFATAKAVANAVKLACAKCDPPRIIAVQKSFVELGVGVAGGQFV